MALKRQLGGGEGKGKGEVVSEASNDHFRRQIIFPEKSVKMTRSGKRVNLILSGDKHCSFSVWIQW